MLGASYVQVSREGLGYQKTQNGGGTMPKAGPVLSAYHRFQSRIDAAQKEKSFFDGLDISIGGIATLAAGGDIAFLRRGLHTISDAVEDAIAKFDAIHPERSADALAAGERATTALLDSVRQSRLNEQAKYDVLHELEIKRVQFNNALAEALGLTIDATLAPDKDPDPRFVMFMGDPETPRVAIPGQTVRVNVHAAASVPVRLTAL
jgi:hypothetical protein